MLNGVAWIFKPVGPRANVFQHHSAFIGRVAKRVQHTKKKTLFWQSDTQQQTHTEKFVLLICGGINTPIVKTTSYYFFITITIIIFAMTII